MRGTRAYAAVLLAGCSGEPRPPATPTSSTAQVPPPPPIGQTTDPTAEQVRALLARIDENPNPLHRNYTPAVNALIEIGEPALLPTLELMLADDRNTRLRTQTVIESVTAEQNGFVFGQGWKRPGGEAAYRKLWSELGELNWEDPKAKRAASVELWKKWLLGRGKT